MRVCHISDTHFIHNELEIPPCDLLIHSGDIGGKTNIKELTLFLIWFESQPAKKKVFIAGNHDIILDKKGLRSWEDPITKMYWAQQNKQATELIKNYNVTYLENSACEYEGLKIWGSPYTPSYHRDDWVFNADRGEEISKVWAKIPSDTNILITHGPPYGILDTIDEKLKKYPEEDVHRGCEDVVKVMRKRLTNLKLFCYGHIHERYGVVMEKVSKRRAALFSNGAVTDHKLELTTKTPLIITL